jgi:hypothetical protein
LSEKGSFETIWILCLGIKSALSQCVKNSGHIIGRIFFYEIGLSVYWLKVIYIYTYILYYIYICMYIKWWPFKIIRQSIYALQVTKSNYSSS